MKVFIGLGWFNSSNCGAYPCIADIFILQDWLNAHVQVGFFELFRIFEV
jgi:hypothetical protein